VAGHVRGCAWKASEAHRQQARGGKVDFELITKLPLSLNSKFLKKLKIPKNKSCSTFQALHFSCFDLFQIQLRF
jgi:hypothetical protein